MPSSIGWRHAAGFIKIEWTGGSFHLFVQRRHWRWGRSFWPGPDFTFLGAGPLCMLVLTPKDPRARAYREPRWLPLQRPNQSGEGEKDG